MSAYLLLVLLSITLSASASSGDRADIFQACIRSCDSSHCQNPHPLPLSLRLTLWSCLDDCKYRCMHEVTDAAIRNIQQGIPYAEVEQYYGKWPFWRLAGTQEPASVVFSLLNLYVHLEGGRYLMRKLPSSHPMRPYYRIWTLISVVSWISSAVFHSRDKPLTEKLDYFSAAAAIMFALYGVGIRVFRAYSSPVRWSAWSTICLGAYLGHVTYLSSTPRFDYTWNVVFNSILGALHNLFWLVFGLRFIPFKRLPGRPARYIPRYAWKATALALLTTLATLLELFDFPPWERIVDAHSLWHLATVPITSMWYRFLAEDGMEPGWNGAIL